MYHLAQKDGILTKSLRVAISEYVMPWGYLRKSGQGRFRICKVTPNFSGSQVSSRGWHKIFQGRGIFRICYAIGWHRKFPRNLIQGKKKHININKFAGLSRDWAGAKILFMCFFGVIPYGGEKTHKQSPPQNPGTIPWKFCLRVFSLCVFLLPINMPSFLAGW